MDIINLVFSIISEINSKIDNLIKEYHLGFYDTFRSNPLINYNDYLYHTVEYGKYFFKNKHNLLFGGELDLLNNNPYDIIITSCLWRYFNILNDVEFIKLKQIHNKIKYNTNFGIKYIIKNNSKYTRQFEIISNPINIFNNIIYYLDKFYKLDYGLTLYNRFKLFGFIDHYNSIDFNNINDLINESINLNKVIDYDIGQYTNPNARYLNSVMDYHEYLKNNNLLTAQFKLLYEDNIIQDLNLLKSRLKSIYHDVLYLSFINHHPIVYLTRQ